MQRCAVNTSFQHLLPGLVARGWHIGVPTAILKVSMHTPKLCNQGETFTCGLSPYDIPFCTPELAHKKGVGYGSSLTGVVASQHIHACFSCKGAHGCVGHAHLCRSTVICHTISSLFWRTQSYSD